MVDASVKSEIIEEPQIVYFSDFMGKEEVKVEAEDANIPKEDATGMAVSYVQGEIPIRPKTLVKFRPNIHVPIMPNIYVPEWTLTFPELSDPNQMGPKPLQPSQMSIPGPNPPGATLTRKESDFPPAVVEKISKSDLKPVYMDILPNADPRTKKLPMFVVKNGPNSYHFKFAEISLDRFKPDQTSQLVCSNYPLCNCRILVKNMLTSAPYFSVM